MARISKERWLYFILALVITASVIWGFYYTYIGPWLSDGMAGDLPAAVHVHGISFLGWYALLVVQATLVVSGAVKIHRWLGLVSIPLAILMVGTGLLVIGVQMQAGLYEDDQFWATFSLVILSNLILFAGFLILALIRRNRMDQHRRLIIAAAATGSGAAVFRIFFTLAGPGFYAVPTGILVTNLFIVLAMVGDRIVLGKVHRIYWTALAVALATEVALFGLAFTEPGIEIQRAFVSLLEPAFRLY
ncbi:hypothetical protein [Aurantiacibacter odishensis]|uniref:hypothetical protein n=1 Tax=Aurantiacibacter odishensis TaxID=1155476 RepID=UPI000E740EAE|nr:hypothetical protein [Aurantiacibacter odishensis]